MCSVQSTNESSVKNNVILIGFLLPFFSKKGKSYKRNLNSLWDDDDDDDYDDYDRVTDADGGVELIKSNNITRKSTATIITTSKYDYNEEALAKVKAICYTKKKKNVRVKPEGCLFLYYNLVHYCYLVLIAKKNYICDCADDAYFFPVKKMYKKKTLHAIHMQFLRCLVI